MCFQLSQDLLILSSGSTEFPKKSLISYSQDNKTLCQGIVLFVNQGLLQISNF